MGFVTWRRLLGGWDLVEDGWFHGGECRSGWGYAGWCSVSGEDRRENEKDFVRYGLNISICAVSWVAWTPFVFC